MNNIHENVGNEFALAHLYALIQDVRRLSLDKASCHETPDFNPKPSVVRAFFQNRFAALICQRSNPISLHSPKRREFPPKHHDVTVHLRLPYQWEAILVGLYRETSPAALTASSKDWHLLPGEQNHWVRSIFIPLSSNMYLYLYLYINYVYVCFDVITCEAHVSCRTELLYFFK